MPVDAKKWEGRFCPRTWLYPKFDSWPNDVLFTRKISKIVNIEFDS